MEKLTCSVKLLTESGKLIAILPSGVGLKGALGQSVDSIVKVQFLHGDVVDSSELLLTECFLGSFDAQSDEKWIIQQKNPGSLKTLITAGVQDDPDYVEGVCFGHLAGIDSRCVFDTANAVELILNRINQKDNGVGAMWSDKARPMISHGELISLKSR
jgi:hypothetical protein